MSGSRIRKSKLLLPLAVAGIAAALGLAGCATKGYVNDELKNIEERVDRVEAATGDASAEARAARELAMQGDERAQQALLQAELARDIALGNIEREEVRRDAIYFGFNSAELSDDAELTLARIAEDVRSNPNYIVLLTGYSDPAGDPTYNIQLAERRAAAARRHLAELLGPEFVRVASIGIGELDPATEGRTSNRESRRVDAAIVRPVSPESSAATKKAGGAT